MESITSHPREASALPSVLTFVIADVRGYTRFTREHGDEAAARLAKRFADLARDAVEARRGRVIELRGDEALAVFGDPAQAIRAALEFQATCSEEVTVDPSLPLLVGIGVDRGEAIPVEDGFRGVALNMAARLCSQAAAGQVLVTSRMVSVAPELADEVRFDDRGTAELKGFEEPEPLFEAAASMPSAVPAAEPADESLPFALEGSTPLIDRDDELRWLRGTWRIARRGRGRLVLVSGPSQIGKTRLAGELAGTVRGSGSVRYAGPGGAATAVAMSELRASLSDDGPTLLVLDDVDVAGEPVAVALAAGLEQIGSRPVMILGLLQDPGASPALADLIERVDERGDGHVRLGPLDAGGVRGIAELYLGDDAEDAPLEAMTRSSGGVPGKVHEVVSAWARDEASRRLAAAAEFLAEGRDRRAGDLDFANNVIELKLGRLYTVDGRDPALVDRCPYKGLRSFDADDADLFFGRERLVGELAARTVGTGLLGVVGASGSGKSSVVSAGLVASLREGLLPGSDRWRSATLRPGEHPMTSLDEALAPLGLTPADLVGAGAGRLVLIVDQFEEIFTVCADEGERAAFVESIVRPASLTPDDVLAVVAIRGDFYGHCADHPALASAIAANHVLVGAMSRGELRRAIELPARRAGVRVETPLTEALVDEVTDEPGGLPLLSTALVELWDGRSDGWLTFDTYERTGGVRGAVARLAEATYGSLTSPQQATARSILLRLVGPGEGDAIARRRASLSEFDVDRDATTASVLRRLTDARLLTTDGSSVEVAHEAVLREWPRLQGWLEEDAQRRMLREHVREAARSWDRSGRDEAELYRGARLAAAMDHAAEHGPELNELERAFLAASRRESDAEAEGQRRTNRRLRALLVGVVAFLVVALVAGAVAIVQRGRANTAATTADASRVGAQAVVEDDLDTSLLLAAEALGVNDSTDTRSTLLASLLKAPGAIRVMSGTGSRVNQMQASADGSVFITVDNIGGVAIYDADALTLRRTLTVADTGPLALTPDGSTILATSFADPMGFVRVDVATGEMRTDQVPEGGRFDGGELAVDPDRRSFVVLESRGELGHRPTLVRRDLETLRASDAARLPFDVDGPLVLFSPDGRRIFVNGLDGLVMIDAATLRVMRTYGDARFPYAASPDGRTVAFGREDGGVSMLDLASGRVTDAQSGHDAAVQGVGFTPDGHTLVTSGDDRNVIVWEVDGTSLVLREILTGHAGRPFGPVFDGDGTTAFTAGLDDGRVIAWDLTSERRLGERFTFEHDPGRLCCVPAFGFDTNVVASPDGSRLAFPTPDGRVVVKEVGSSDVLWEADPWTDERMEELAELDAVTDAFTQPYVTDLSFSPDDRLLAVAGGNLEAVVYDVATGEVVRRILATESGWVNGVSFAPDGSIVTANDDGLVAQWDPVSGTLLRSWRVQPVWRTEEEFPGPVWRALMSPDGSMVAVEVLTPPDGEAEVLVLDAASGRELWRGPADPWTAVIAWSGDSRHVGVGGRQSGDLAVYEARTGEPVQQPVLASAGFVTSLEFSPSRGLWVTGGSDGSLRLFDDASLRQVGSNIVADEAHFTFGRVVEGGDSLLVFSDGGRGWRWTLDPERWRQQACEVAGRTLTRMEWDQFLPARPYAPTCVGTGP